MDPVTIIGSGNAATQLATALHQKGVKIDCVYSRNLEHAEALAVQVDSKAVDRPELVPDSSGVYLLAVSDTAIAEVSSALKVKGLVAHVSGITPMSILERNGEYGVFYPLQTMNKSTAADFSEVPFMIEANTESGLNKLKALASLLSSKVMDVDSAQRQVVHLAAVFANNFTNHLFHIAGSILQPQGLSLEVLLPLINETVSRAAKNNPAAMQTGPARRHDQATIEKHLGLLKSYPEYRQIYEVLSQSIGMAYPENKKP